jgi:hypothetical protein
MTKLLLLFMFLLTGFGMYSQQVAKNALQVLPIGKSVEQTVPQNYTATKITLSQGASAQVKEDFVKLHNADFYYVYTDAKGKNVTKDELEEVLRKQNESIITPSKLVTNPKK